MKKNYIDRKAYSTICIIMLELQTIKVTSSRRYGAHSSLHIILLLYMPRDRFFITIIIIIILISSWYAFERIVRNRIIMLSLYISNFFLFFSQHVPAHSFVIRAGIKSARPIRLLQLTDVSARTSWHSWRLKIHVFEFWLQQFGLIVCRHFHDINIYMLR